MNTNWRLMLLSSCLTLLAIACSVEEDIHLPEASDNQTDGLAQTVRIQTLTIRVLDEASQPLPDAIIGSIPTLNPVLTLEQTPTDAKERQLTLNRFVTDDAGEYRFLDMTFNALQSPLIFNAYYKDQSSQRVLFGSTFVDLETDTQEVNVTIQLVGKDAINPNVRIALFDPEPFPRAIDFLSREGIYFDNLIYEQYYQAGEHDWQDWTGNTWEQVFAADNLAQYDVFMLGFDASKYAEFDLLVKHKQALIDFIEQNPDKLLFLAQQNHTSFTWSWLADFDLPQEGQGGGFLTTLYETAHLEDAELTSIGMTHPLFIDSPLASPLDSDNNNVPDAWENWDHIEPNKPQVKLKVAWHAGNTQVFNDHGWAILVQGPAKTNYFDLPQGSGVVAAVKPFANGSRIFFSDATYYQASYGPQKAASAILLKNRLVSYLATWPEMRLAN